MIIPEGDVLEPELDCTMTFCFLVVGIFPHAEEVVESNETKIAYAVMLLRGIQTVLIEEKHPVDGADWYCYFGSGRGVFFVIPRQ